MDIRLEEIFEELSQMPENGDEEILHGRADELLCKALVLLGRDDIARAFKNAAKRVGFWYA